MKSITWHGKAVKWCLIRQSAIGQPRNLTVAQRIPALIFLIMSECIWSVGSVLMAKA